MKIFHIIILVLSISLNLDAQNDTVYFNYKWQQTSRDSALYYRIAEKQDKGFLVKDFYMNDSLQMQGIFSTLEPELRNGYFIWYFENGQKYAEGNYLHGKRDGIWTFWYPDGVKKEEMEFKAEQDFYTVKWESKRLKSSREILKKVQKKNEKGKTQEATLLLDNAIQIHPYSADLFFERSLIFCAIQKKSQCCNDLQKARELGFYDMNLLNEQIEIFCQPLK